MVDYSFKVVYSVKIISLKRLYKKNIINLMMFLNIDNIIFTLFLLANFIFGMASSRGIKTIKEYAVGERNFNTATIVSTIVATWVSGEYFFTISSEAYKEGLYFIWGATLSDLVCFLLIALFFAPRMGEFLGKLSVAEAMGDLYGNKVRIITAISGFIGITGIISIQLKAAGIVFEYALGLNPYYGSVIAGILIAFYSSLGGVKSVTFTDIIQFITFGIVIPVILYFLLNSISNIDIVGDTLGQNPLFDYHQVFDFSQDKALYFLFLFFFSAIPGFSPAMFQRISMAHSTRQVSKSFSIAAFTCFFLGLTICWIGVLTFAIHPDIGSSDVVKIIITDYSNIIGLKGIILVGIMAMIMSTVDSYINSTSVIVVHDFLKPLKLKIATNELLSARIVSFLIGIVAIVLSLRDNSLLGLLIISYSFYMPIVTVPFTMAICGFRTSPKSVILGMIAGLTTVLAWDYYEIKIVESVIPGMFANLVILLSSHYLLNQPGGWVGIKDKEPLLRLKHKRREIFNSIKSDIKNFNLINICRKSTIKGDGFISIMGLFVMISVFSSFSTLHHKFQEPYSNLLNILYPIALTSSTALLSYPLWLERWKNTDIITIIWSMILFTVLVCFSFLTVLISQFSEIQLMIFMVNIMVISSLTRWRWALFNIIFGMATVTYFYINHIAIEPGEGSLVSSEFKTVYLLLLIISSLVFFLKPRQLYQEKIELRSDYLSNKLDNQKKELEKSLEIKYEFLRNLEHETQTPITGISSMGQALYCAYHKLSDEERYEAVKDIAQSSVRLNSMVENILNLSKLSNLEYTIDKKKINFSQMIRERIDICRKLYVQEGSQQEFDINIEPNIKIFCDQKYLSTAIDNVIINAIQYCKNGLISIKLSKIEKNEIEFTVKDEGIGIPKKELYSVFSAFTVASNTKTPAGGRGVGLTLCKRVVELHNGKIGVKLNSDKGVTFNIILPTM